MIVLLKKKLLHKAISLSLIRHHCKCKGKERKESSEIWTSHLCFVGVKLLNSMHRKREENFLTSIIKGNALISVIDEPSHVRLKPTWYVFVVFFVKISPVSRVRRALISEPKFCLWVAALGQSIENNNSSDRPCHTIFVLF